MAVIGGTQTTTSHAAGSGGGGSTSPGGTPTQLQFNNTVFGGVKGTAVDATTGVITVTATAANISPVVINGNGSDVLAPLLVLSGLMDDSTAQLQLLAPDLPAGSFFTFLFNSDNSALIAASIDGGITSSTMSFGAGTFVISNQTGAIAQFDATGLNLEVGAYQVNGTPGVTQTAGTPTSIATMGGIVTTLVVTSDERLKDAIAYTGGLQEILAIHPVRYKWNVRGQEVTGDKNLREYVGFLAQNVQRVIPEAIVGQQVAKDGQVYLGFDDRPVIAALVNAVKELKAEIELLKNSR